MPFDISTAKPLNQGKFDISTAKPLETQPLSFEQQIAQQEEERMKRMPAVKKMTDYFFPQALTGAKMERGQQTIYGDIFERPGAAIRSAIQGQDYAKGAVNPEEVPSFAETFYLKSGIQPTGNRLMDIAKASPFAVAGTVADIATNPAQGLLTAFGMTSAGKQVGAEVGKAGKLVKDISQKVTSLPIAETAKRGLLNVVEGIKSLPTKLPTKMDRNWLLTQSAKTASITDEAVNSIRAEYDDLYKGIGKIETDKTEVRNVIESLLRGATKEEADEVINSLKTELGQELSPNLETVKKIKDIVQRDIPESVWMKGKKGYDLTPAQSRKVKAYFQLKNIIEKGLAGTEEGEYLKYLDKKATDTYRLSKALKRMVVDVTGEPTETGRLVGAFSGKAGQAGKENLFYRMKNFNQDIQEIIDNMGKFRTRQALKRIGLRTGIGLGAEELIRRNLFTGR